MSGKATNEDYFDEDVMDEEQEQEQLVVGGQDDMFAGGAKKVREGYDSYGLYDTSSNKTTGRYISKTPSSAAKKAARRLFKKSPRARELTVYIRKTTRGSKREIYRYKAVLEVLKNPLIVNKEGTQIQVKNKVTVVSEDLPPSVASVMNAKKEMEKEKMMKKKMVEKEKMMKKKMVEKAKREKAVEKARVKKATKKTTAKKTTKKVTGGGCGYGSCNTLYV